MGILSRFKNIMEANINALLDQAEDPEKMIDQYMRNLQEDFSKVKAETASVMADEKAAQRRLEECDEEISKMDLYARKAVEAGNDDDAKKFLARGNELKEQRKALETNYNQCKDASQKMRQMHDKLASDIETLNARRSTLKAKARVAKTQKKMNDLGSSIDGAGKDMDAFGAMEEKINKQLDEADAMAELNQSSEKADVDDLAEKYENSSSEEALDEQLAALKASMNGGSTEGKE